MCAAARRLQNASRMNKRDLSILLFPLLLATPGCLDAGDAADLGAPDEDVAAATSAVVGGSFEADEKYPWVVSLNGCHGVLIDPAWVLTAAHCVPRNGWSYQVTYSRTDSLSGQVHTGSSRVGYSGVFVHPDYRQAGGFDSGHADIALIRLDTPFAIDKYISTVAIPTAPRVVGRTGTIAGGSHSNPSLAAGLVAVLRTAISDDRPLGCGGDGQFCITSPTASLCPGDSGSGFVTVEGGRATVAGVASYANVTTCDTVHDTDYAGLTDVYSFRDWILSTMHTTDAALGGNTRVHASGRAADGVIGIGCTNPYGTMVGTMRAPGVGLGANCAPGETQSVFCWLGNHQAAGDEQMAIRNFTMKTTYANGTSSVTALPFSATTANYFGLLDAGVTREFTCTVNVPRIIRLPPGGLGRIELAQP